MRDKVLQPHIINLLKLAAKNKTDEIYKFLNEFDGTTKQKGDLFEYFLARLYKGIGCKVEVVGGKNDKGVDLVIYYANSPSKVYAIVQVKNLKTVLPKKELLSQYSQFFGNKYSSEQASVEKYNCKVAFIISLNGYIKNALSFDYPEKYQVELYEWAYVKELILDYSNICQFSSHQKICPFKLVHNNTFYFVIVFIILISVAATWFFYKEDVEDNHTLSNEMLVRLNSTPLSSPVKQDCNLFNYPLNKCREKLVYRYQKKYGSLKNGLMAYFCGATNFKRGTCGTYGVKRTLFVLFGKS